MRSNEAPVCITRVVLDGERDLQLVELQTAVQRIQSALQPLPAMQRACLGDALLNFAITHCLGESETSLSVGVARTTLHS